MPTSGTPATHADRPPGAGDGDARVDAGIAAPQARADEKRTATHCPYCSLQCGMALVQVPGEPLSVAARDFPTNRGAMCRKGWSAAALLSRRDRLTTPLLRDRRGEDLRPASWDEALDRVAGELRSCQSRYGRDAAGVFGGGGLTNETVSYTHLTLPTKRIV